jgi:hypothetical protein
LYDSKLKYVYQYIYLFNFFIKTSS